MVGFIPVGRVGAHVAHPVAIGAGHLAGQDEIVEPRIEMVEGRVYRRQTPLPEVTHAANSFLTLASSSCPFWVSMAGAARASAPSVVM
jgi:hypothetical protein